ncbi:acyl-CoA dehydrogenase family protein [Pseudonocardia sp. TRM90224]|uniref:acyl-CoA dehydrogenase family protein n=1 Tax=Pseudonocardia sp. TRM90224 TaxID=2812678 RepID=UPI001E411082|nr:acyl-CoA dehydrogenase family protein [Pseudonocardia sp. TRM90224]
MEKHAIDVAAELRGPDLVLDADPDTVAAHLDLPALRLHQATMIPPAHTEQPYRIDGKAVVGGSCLVQTVVTERLSYGDPGLVLVAPGPSLSGVVLDGLGDAAQQQAFYRRFTQRFTGPTWTFFALTEHGKGSAAAELETTLLPAADPGHFTLHGTKRYIGNGAHAQVGVVFARRAPGPFGIEAVLVDATAPGLTADLLPTIGLTGARIAQLTFDGLLVGPDMILGRTRRPSRRGLLGAREALHFYRPLLAARAIGVADAVLDHVRDARGWLPAAGQAQLDTLRARIRYTRDRVRAAASAVDAGSPPQHDIAAGKLGASRLAEEATLLAVELLGPTTLLEDPWLAKAYRDVRAFEIMDGVGDLHRLQVFQGVLRGVAR